MDLQKCFSAHGHFIPSLYYAERFNFIPNYYEISLKQEDNIDIVKISKNVKEFFGENFATITSVFNNEIKTSAVDDDDDMVYRNGTFVTTNLKVIDPIEFRFFELTKDTISVYHMDNASVIEEYLEKLRKKLPKLESKPKAAEIGLIAYDQGYHTIKSKITKTEIDIEENYNDDFQKVYQDVIDFLNSRSSGLIILNGTKGTGKTSLIRHLCSSFPAKYRIVTNAIASRLAEPDFMSYLLDNKNSVFILEDCEQILMDRSENTFGGAIANILNMSDGLMSDIFNIKFICTFNADINKIDSALLRKGRCYANYEFKPLCKEKVKHLSEKYNLGIKEYKDMTLAEIYNYESTDYDVESKPKKRIGF